MENDCHTLHSQERGRVLLTFGQIKPKICSGEPNTSNRRHPSLPQFEANGS